MYEEGAVFDRLKKAGLMLNPKKCRIVCNEVEYLGHVVIPQGLNQAQQSKFGHCEKSFLHQLA